YEGEFPADYASAPDPDPQLFGLPVEDDGKRDDVLMAQNMISCTSFEPDFDALQHARTHVVLAAGEESNGQMASRAAHVVADRLGQTVTMFPSGHGGFVEGWGQPEAFAARLHEVLAANE